MFIRSEQCAKDIINIVFIFTFDFNYVYIGFLDTISDWIKMITT